MPLPNPGMSFTPLDPLPAADLNDIVENVEALADWSAYTANSLPTSLLTDALLKGWIAASGSWSYASATTITVPSADAARLSVGSKIWITQTTSKWFYVTGVSGTTVTVTGGSDYTVDNAAITAPYFSNESTPQGFPDGFTDANGWKIRYQGSRAIYGKKVTYSQAIGGTGGNINAGMSSTNMPVGMSTLGTNFFSVQYMINGNSFGFTANPEMTSASSSLNFTGRSNDGTGRTYTGYFDIEIKTA